MAKNEKLTESENFEFGKWLSGFVSKLPAREKVVARFNKVDDTLTPYYGVLSAWLMLVIGTNFYRFGPTDVPTLEYFTKLFAGLNSISVAIVGVALFESLRRNEIGDMVKVIIAIVVNYVVMVTSGSWSLMIVAYGIGFSLAHSASRHGKLDWTPLVAYNAAFIGLSSHVFGFAAVSIVWPVMVSVLFQVVEIFRNQDYRAVRLAVPGVIISMIGLVFTMDPVMWVLAGALVSFVVAPTLCKLNASKHKLLADTCNGCSSPFQDFENGMKEVRMNAEAAMLTLVSSSLFFIIMVMFS